MRGGVLIIIASALLLGACGGGSSRLSASDYKAEIAKVKQESANAQADVAKGLQAKTIAELRQRLAAFAAASDRIGDEVGKLKAPKDAEAANAELAQGEHDGAKAVRAASTALAKLKTPQAAVAYLQNSLSGSKAGHELDDAVAKLTKLGYTTGS